MATTAQRKGPDMETQSGMACARCQGPTVPEVFVDWTSGGGHLSFPGRRCLLCGDITDSLILSHRATRPKPGACKARPPRGQSLTAVSIAAGRAHHSGGSCPQ